MADKPAPHVTVGVLGWGNRKSGLEAYGEGGRWGNGKHGDLLGDALEREGQHEGAHLIVVALPRFGAVTDERALEAVRETIDKLVQEAASS